MLRVKSSTLCLKSLVVSRISIIDALQRVKFYCHIEQQCSTTHVLSTIRAVSSTLLVRCTLSSVLVISFSCNGQIKRLPNAFHSLTGFSIFSIRLLRSRWYTSRRPLVNRTSVSIGRKLLLIFLSLSTRTTRLSRTFLRLVTSAVTLKRSFEAFFKPWR
jgi:hypothetical protein